ncbi:MAG: hypothetical protein JNL34_07420 [Anaerolineae bacterium]|nr:hypothetical protein [Anaerolineae bacterium]
MIRAARTLLIFCCGLLAACVPSSEPPLAWSAPQLIAPALQWDAPAAAFSRGQIAFVWTGFDAENIHQDVRRGAGETLEPVLILPLPPAHPLDQQIVPGADGAFHLFWLDAALDGEGNRLYSALLSSGLQVERGPVELATAPAYSFAVITRETGGTLAVWSQGNPAEPELWSVELDATGLPRQPQQVGVNSRYPALARRMDGAIQVFRESEGRLWTSPWAEDGRLEWTALTATVGRMPGDRLEALWAASCGLNMCVGWNIARQNGRAESWLADGAADARSWAAPHKLEEVTWLTPETGTRNASGDLYAAAQTDTGIALVTIRNGNVTIQEMAAVNVVLSGLPALARTDDTLVLSWAETGADYANLLFTQRMLPNDAR